MHHWVKLSLADAMLFVDAMSKVKLYLTDIYEQEIGLNKCLRFIGMNHNFTT